MTAIARENLEDRLADRLSAPALRVPVFHEVCAPTAGQLQALLTRITERLMKLIIDTQHCHASDAFHGWQSGTGAGPGARGTPHGPRAGTNHGAHAAEHQALDARSVVQLFQEQGDQLADLVAKRLRANTRLGRLTQGASA